MLEADERQGYFYNWHFDSFVELEHRGHLVKLHI